MIRIYRDPFDALKYEEVSFSGKYIDWLQETYPNGFEGKHQTRINGSLVGVENYDVEIELANEVDLLLLPGDPSTAIGLAIWKAVAAAAVSAAISYVANALFGSKPTKAGAQATTPAAARANSLGVPTNAARLNEPIPVQYGRLRSTPDLAAEPYRWYDGNEQYIGVILALGHGEFTVHDVLISDTPIGQLAAGVGTKWQYGYSQHGGVHGYIEGETGIYEDIETSIEVADQELQEPYTAGYAQGAAEVYTTGIQQEVIGTGVLKVLSAPTPAAMRSWSLNDAVTVTEYGFSYSTETISGGGTAESESSVTYDLTAPAAGGAVSGTITVSTTTELDLAPDSVTVNGSTYYEIQTYAATISSLSADFWQIMYDDATITPSQAASLYRVERDDGGVFMRYTVSKSTGPFAAVGPGRTARAVQVDIECPGGLYKMNDETGGLMQENVGFDIIITRIDDDGNFVSTLATHSENIGEATNASVRRTYTYSVNPPYRVAVAVTRTNNPSNRAQDVSETYWTQLRGIRPLSTPPVYGDVTLLAVKLRATDGISSGAANQISVDATRKLNGIATSNPAEALKDAWTSTVYGGRRPLSELDTDAVAEISSVATGHNGFNFRFTSKRSLWDAMQAILRPLDYYPVPAGAVISFARDSAIGSNIMSFTTANMTDVTRLCQWDRADQTDGFEVTYTDPASGAEASVYYPSSSVDSESVVLEGCTSVTVAEDFARGLWLRQQYRREYLTWTTELEGHLAPIGQRVGVTYPLVGSASYVVQSAESVDEHRVRLVGWRHDARQYA